MRCADRRYPSCVGEQSYESNLEGGLEVSPRRPPALQDGHGPDPEAPGPWILGQLPVDLVLLATLDCQFETICERCGFYDTGPHFIEILRRQHNDAIDHGDHDRAQTFTGLLDGIDDTS